MRARRGRISDGLVRICRANALSNPGPYRRRRAAATPSTTTSPSPLMRGRVTVCFSDVPTEERHVDPRAIARSPRPTRRSGSCARPAAICPSTTRPARAPAVFSTCARTRRFATEVTLQPLARFPLDAAILFSDILTIPDAMGLGLYFAEGEGPRFERPLRDERAIRDLAVPDPTTQLRYVSMPWRRSARRSPAQCR